MPASFTPPPIQEIKPAIMQPPPSTIDVVQVSGSNNHYVALIKEGDQLRQVRAGDHLNDNSVVLGVSKLGVELQRGDKPARMIEVKDVQSVFGASP
jgi:hypothetical protein